MQARIHTAGERPRPRCPWQHAAREGRRRRPERRRRRIRRDQADEFFFLLEGELDVWVGDQHTRLEPGMSATLPRGVVHRFDNLAKRPAKVLIVVSPGAGARFFDELDRERPELPREIDKVVSTLARHDIQVVG